MTNEEMLCAKICHDLINPINAVNLCLESYEMTGDPTLLVSMKDSLHKCTQLLVFIRAMTTADRDFSYHEIKNLVNNYLALNKISVNFQSDMTQFNKKISKILLNLSQTAKDIMPFGGNIDFFIKEREIILKLSGNSLICKRISRRVESYREIFDNMLYTNCENFNVKLTMNIGGNSGEMICNY